MKRFTRSCFFLTTVTSLFVGTSLPADTILLEKFTHPLQTVEKQWNRKGKGVFTIESVEVAGETRNALRLETVKEEKEHTWPVITKRFAIPQPDKVTLTYYLKSAAGKFGYGIFVKDGSRQMVAVLVREGHFRYFDKHWRNATVCEAGRWYKLKYEISCHNGTYDLFVDDMDHPVVSNIGYRHPGAARPNNLWCEGAEGQEETTWLADITVSNEKQSFPPPKLASAPNYIFGCRKTAVAPVVDGLGNDACWRDASSVSFRQEAAGKTKDSTSTKLLWDNENFYLLFTCNVGDMSNLRALEKEHDGRVWMDDCAEIFLDPGLSGKNYFHWVGNAIGTKYDCKIWGSKDKSFESGWQLKTSRDATSWTAEVRIPFHALGNSPKVGDLWGMNLGRENPRTEEVSAWRPLNNFHQPRFFGKLLFVDASYAASGYAGHARELVLKLHPADAFSTEQAELVSALNTQDIPAEFKNSIEPLVTRFRELTASLNDTKENLPFYAYDRMCRELLDTQNRMTQLEVKARAFKTFFAPGSEGALKGYVVCLESSMTKVMKSYIGSSPAREIAFDCARNEGEGFQMVLVARSGVTFDKVAISVSDLTHAGTGATIPAANLRSYKIGYIATHKTSLVPDAPEMWPDVMWDGREFALPAVQMQPLWFDLDVPKTAVGGIYRGTVTITPNDLPATSLPLQVKVWNFELPNQPGLKNIFCFAPSWAEKFYGRKLTPAERKSYFLFLLKHRLEPVNLWSGGKLMMTEDELEFSIKHGKDLIMVPIWSQKESNKGSYKNYLDNTLGMLRRRGWIDKAMLFGFDEVLCRPERVPQMQEMFDYSKQLAPDVPRLNTAPVDKRLFGYVDVWCPLFQAYDHDAAVKRQERGEEVWWYPTDHPGKPFANFNMKSPGIDPRIIPWMNWKLGIDGLLYWGVNREWLTNGTDQNYLTEGELKRLNAEWMTPELRKQMKQGKRWPEVPWLPYFRSVISHRVALAACGAGNVMYPGPDRKPLPSTRLKNLRDGLEDYDYLLLLRKKMKTLKAHDADAALIGRIEPALAVNPAVVTEATEYTKNPKILLEERARIAELIEEADRVLKE